MIFYAHSVENSDEQNWQPLQQHLHNTAALAREFAAYYPQNAQALAETAALMHDQGKYSIPFQKRLRGGPKVDHATAGAKFVLNKYPNVLGKILAFCIAGHHAGLANGAREEKLSTLQQRLASDTPEADPVWQQELTLPEQFQPPKLQILNKNEGCFALSFFTRMIYSCVVDADYLDTEAFYSKVENKSVERGNYPDLNTLQQRFIHYIQNKFQPTDDPLKTEEAKKAEANQELNQIRSHIFDYAVQQAALPPGLFTLTVPTGGGKTFTSMAFALEHAKLHHLRRIIYVIPFTSIIEQNAAEFRKAFEDLGEQAVLEHHSNFDDSHFVDKSSKDKLRLASENWDMPVVVTTAVQFFESLFANRSSRCRKLHNIAGSVIILDEAQMLPLNLLRPIMAAINELAHNYRCSVVMCTATQPAIHQQNGFYNGFKNTRELAPEPEKLFEKLARTTVQYVGEKTDADLLADLTNHAQILVIVNNRRHAQSLYQSAKSLEGAFHLSTLMCAAHRTQVLNEIRSRLKEGSPCRVIATPLVEAGVDIDFPRVMRAEAGLDSVAQAAGRCNREGKRKAEESSVLIFKPEDQWQPPAELKTYAACMRSVVRHHQQNLLSPQAISDYFSQVYALKDEELDKEGILKDCHNSAYDFPFDTMAKNFRMIQSHLVPLIIRFDNEAKAAVEALQTADKIGGILRNLQRYTVQIPENVLAKLYSARMVDTINDDKFGKQFYYLINDDLYDNNMGLTWDNPEHLGAKQCCI